MTDKIQLVFSMLIFSTIGLFVRLVSLPSGFIAMCRGFVGVLFLLIFSLVSKKKISFAAIRKNWLLLLLSGAAIGINWVLLFEAYRYTSVAVATLCYYFAPIFLIIVSSVILREKLTLKKIICITGALIGMACISGIFSPSFSFGSIKGILLGTGAAVFYTSVIIINKFLKDITALEKTICQLLIAAIIIVPYFIISESSSISQISFTSVSVLILIGILHTGIAYVLYFNSIKSLPPQTVAILSYIDPAAAILLSTIILKENIGLSGALGALLIIASAMASEFDIKK